MKSDVFFVLGPQAEADRDDGLPGHARGKDCDGLLRERFRQHNVSEFLLHKKGRCIKTIFAQSL